MLNDYACSEGVSCTYISDVCVGLRMMEVLRSESWNWHFGKCAALQTRLNFQTLQAIIIHVATGMGLGSSERFVM